MPAPDYEEFRLHGTFRIVHGTFRIVGRLHGTFGIVHGTFRIVRFFQPLLWVFAPNNLDEKNKSVFPGEKYVCLITFQCIGKCSVFLPYLGLIYPLQAD